jgi:hypothetical protein
MALRIASRVTMCEKRTSSVTNRTMRRPERCASRLRRVSAAGKAPPSGNDKPKASMTQANVEAVPMVSSAPAARHAAFCGKEVVGGHAPGAHFFAVAPHVRAEAKWLTAIATAEHRSTGDEHGGKALASSALAQQRQRGSLLRLLPGAQGLHQQPRRVIVMAWVARFLTPQDPHRSV